MQVEIEGFLSPRIVKHCLPLYRDCYYGEAAHKAMTQVERALKEKGEITGGLFGVRLVRHLLGPGQHGKLKVPLGDDLQKHAETLFEGAFAYYRNYAAHDGSEIDNTICLRILVLASELLDLIDASALSFADLGGIAGLLKAGAFPDKQELARMLDFLVSYCTSIGDYNAFFEELHLSGFSDAQYQAVLDLDLVRYWEKEVPIPPHLIDPHSPDEWEIIWGFELTDLGKKAMSAAAKDQ